MRAYHDTVPETRENVKQYSEKSERQDDDVLEYFQHWPNNEYTPDEVHELVFGWTYSAGRKNGVPLTSVRRSITNLTKHGKLIKTDHKRMGKYGRLNNCWRLNLKQGRLF